MGRMKDLAIDLQYEEEQALAVATSDGEAEHPARWFGGILSWHRSEHGWQARHGGKLHEIAKLGRQAAEEHGTTPGWHLIDHEPGAFWVGPDVGRTCDRAFVMAEAHILVPFRDWFPTNDAPGFISALGGGAVWGRRPLTAFPDSGHGRIVAHDRGDVVVGAIRPLFLIDGDPALEPVRILWEPRLENGPRLATDPSWHAAASALADVIDNGTPPF